MKLKEMKRLPVSCQPGALLSHTGLLSCMLGITVLVFAGLFFSFLINKRKDSSRKFVEKADEFRSLEDYRDYLEFRLGQSRPRLAALTKRNEQQQKRAAAVANESADCKKRMDELLREKSELLESTPMLGRSFEKYRQQSRNRERHLAIGEQVGRLTLTDGKIYEGVKIRRVNAEGLSISHRKGLATVAPSLLPPAWDRRFRWSEDKTEPDGQGDPHPSHARDRNKQATTAGSKQIPNPPEDSGDQAPSTDPEEQSELAKLLAEYHLTVSRYRNLKSSISEAQGRSGGRWKQSVPGELETWEKRAKRLEKLRQPAIEKILQLEIQLRRLDKSFKRPDGFEL